FFSSSRRHPSFSRDWSSDVCSSDLILHRPHQDEPPDRRIEENCHSEPAVRHPADDAQHGCKALEGRADVNLICTVYRAPEREEKIGTASCRETANSHKAAPQVTHCI